ncbi:MAG: hypothetical protein ACKV2V_21110 [Blastocatellia bacterium]
MENKARPTEKHGEAAGRGWPLATGHWLLFLLCLLAASCGGPRAGDARRAGGTRVPWGQVAETRGGGDGDYSQPRQVGEVRDKKLTEISGITAGRASAGVWWVHNDSGAKPQIHAIDGTGKLLASFTVAGAKLRDWEDIAGGPGRDGKPALYIGDIGSNSEQREEYVIYRVREPVVRPGESKGETETAEAFPFVYPDGKHNAEALFVEPKTGRIYIVTKTTGVNCGVYRFPMPLSADRQVTLEKARGKKLSQVETLPLVSGAAAAPDGSRVVIRTYFTALELRRKPGGTFESMFDQEPTSIGVPFEKQGEAIAYTPDSQALVTISEKLPAPLWRMSRE